MKDKMYYFITAALPYANGQLHFGHLAGVYLPADIYFRHCVLLDRNAIFISGSDEHGVAITLSAEKEKKSYQSYVDEYHALHKKLFEAYGIQFSYYGRTTSSLHKQIAQEYFLELKKKKALIEQETPQPYCEKCKKYVPDRYLGGTCSHCDYPQARGDECPNCGKWLLFEELKNPFCQICKGSNIQIKNERQWYLDLPAFAPQLIKWLKGGEKWKKNVQKYAISLVEGGLPKRAVTRNLPWGIGVPEEKNPDKKLYVWFEAPIGYLSILREAFDSKGDRDGWKLFWNKKVKMIHFIGKDNIVFHTIVWPAILMGMGEGILPSNVPANMYVQLGGKQFSKSSGWYVDSLDAINEFGQDKMRYYLSTIIPEQDDTDFTWEGFASRVNTELVNNIANFCNRNLQLVVKNYRDEICFNSFDNVPCQDAIKTINTYAASIRAFLDTFEFRKALGEILRLGELANKFCNDNEPWKLVKTDPKKAKEILCATLLYMAGLGSFLQPFLPNYASQIQSVFSAFDFKKIYNGKFAVECKSATFPISHDKNIVIPRIPAEIVAKKMRDLPNA